MTRVDTMTRRRLLPIVSLPLAVTVIVGVLAMLPPRPGATKANYDRIENGMRLEDVESILGGAGMPIHGTVFDGKQGHSRWRWDSDDGIVTVILTEQSRVRDKWWGEWQPKPTFGMVVRR